MNLRESDSKSVLRGRNIRRQLVQRLAVSRQLLRYTAQDEAAVRSTREIIQRSLEEIASAMYDELLMVPETAEYFLTPDGRPNRAHIDARAMTLQGWLLTAVRGASRR